MVDISVEAHGGDVRTEDSRTEVFHTAIGEAIGDPYEGHRPVKIPVPPRMT